MTAASAPLRVLIVDDEPPIRRFLRTGLTAQGYVTAEAETGKETLAALARGGIDLVVLDLGLPDMDGLDIIKTVREGGSALPIVVLSSRADEAGKVKALDLGADDYVTKPFGVEELLARVRAALRHRLQEQGERPVFKSGDLSVDLVRSGARKLMCSICASTFARCATRSRPIRNAPSISRRSRASGIGCG